MIAPDLLGQPAAGLLAGRGRSATIPKKPGQRTFADRTEVNAYQLTGKATARASGRHDTGYAKLRRRIDVVEPEPGTTMAPW